MQGKYVLTEYRMFSWAYILAKQHILLTYSMGNGKCLEISSVECDF